MHAIWQSSLKFVVSRSIWEREAYNKMNKRRQSWLAGTARFGRIVKMKSENHSKGAKHRAGAEDDERDRDTTKIEITQKAKFDFFYFSFFSQPQPCFSESLWLSGALLAQTSESLETGNNRSTKKLNSKMKTLLPRFSISRKCIIMAINNARMAEGVKHLFGRSTQQKAHKLERGSYPSNPFSHSVRIVF